MLRGWQDIESKKEEFRKYLEQGGVIDALTKGKHCLIATLCVAICDLIGAFMRSPSSTSLALPNQQCFYHSV